MDQQEGLSGNLFKWDPRGPSSSVAPAGAGGGGGMMTPSQYQYQYQYQQYHQQQQQMMHHMLQPTQGQGRAGAGGSSTTQLPPPQGGLGGLEELFQAYGIRYYTASKIAELGFTANTLLDMREEELDDMINSLSHLFRWDLLVGERYGIKAAIRAERRRLHDLDYSSARCPPSATHPLDAFSQEGISEERVVHGEIEVVRSGGGPASWGDVLPIQAPHHQAQRKKPKQHPRPKQRSVTTKKQLPMSPDNDDGDDDDDDDDTDGPAAAGPSSVTERQREHPFIVTEPGEVARGKKNGLDYLFHLYELCHDFLIQVQNLAKDCGDKCPTKVTNQVFRYAKKAGATYINKPKMRHYVHCYALHCLDEDTSNALRRAFKERGENVGAWRQACYKPLVSLAARQASWDIDSIFNAHPRLSIWYVPTKLRQLCHAERSAAAAAASANSTLSMATTHLLPF